MMDRKATVSRRALARYANAHFKTAYEDYFEEAGWVPLTGAAKAKAERVTGESRLDYAKRFGRKTIFLRDSGGAFRLRAIGPRGEVYQLKEHSPQSADRAAIEMAHAAMSGIPGKGMYVVEPGSRYASLTGSYADYAYQGEEAFLGEAVKLIKRIAGSHARMVKVQRQGGRSPLLVYEGEDRSDIGLEVVFHLIVTSMNEVRLSWWGHSEQSGKIDGDWPFKWGMLKPSHVADRFTDLFGR